ncbi:MAG: ABC transporter permease [Fimbriimonadaceae bacterium]|nr:ABC transporter permease [Fimbriimonadaceae bacterium]
MASAPTPRAPTWRIREKLSPLTGRLLGLVLPAVLLAVWWLLTRDRLPGTVESRVVPISILPAPHEMFSTQVLRELWFERELSRGALSSLVRVAAGFSLAALLAVPLGVVMGTFTRAAAMVRPLMTAGGYLPVAALVPLTIAWFGTGEEQKVGFIAIATFVFLLPMVFTAVDSVDTVFLQTAQTQGATRWQQLSRVLLPVAAPDIYHGLRLGFGVAWSWIILAEVVAAQGGLGFIINTTQSRGANIAHLYLTLVVILSLAFLLDRGWHLGARALFPYRSRAHG